MSQVPSQDGTIPFTAPGTDKVCSTYYKVIGDRSSGAPPIVYLHGGPGGGHDYLVPFAQQIWTTYGIPGVLYDQLGCGSSTRLPERAGDGSFWTISLFIAELDNLLDHLCLRNGFHIFGQSWGGMLGADFATSRPPGLCRLVIASGLASHATMVQGTKLLRADLTSEQQATLNKAEESALKENFDEWDSLAAQEILALMASKHVCRAKTMPSELLPAFKNLSEDPTVYQAMLGKHWLLATGSLRNWSCIPRLHQITAPTLVYNGEFDTSHDVATVPFFELIPRVRWITFAGSGHFCHLEDGGLRDKVLMTVGDFLVQGNPYE